LPLYNIWELHLVNFHIFLLINTHTYHFAKEIHFVTLKYPSHPVGVKNFRKGGPANVVFHLQSDMLLSFHVNIVFRYNYYGHGWSWYPLRRSSISASEMNTCVFFFLSWIIVSENNINMKW
jgi:hypothetical protein